MLLSRPSSTAEVPDHPQWTDAVISNIDQEHKPTFASLCAYTPLEMVVGKLLAFWEGPCSVAMLVLRRVFADSVIHTLKDNGG